MTKAELMGSAASLTLPFNRLDRREATFRVWVGGRELDQDEFTIERRDHGGMTIILAVPVESVKAGVQLVRNQ